MKISSTATPICIWAFMGQSAASRCSSTKDCSSCRFSVDRLDLQLVGRRRAGCPSAPAAPAARLSRAGSQPGRPPSPDPCGGWSGGSGGCSPRCGPCPPPPGAWSLVGRAQIGGQDFCQKVLPVSKSKPWNFLMTSWSSSEKPMKALYMEASSKIGWPTARVSMSMSSTSSFCSSRFLVW